MGGEKDGLEKYKLFEDTNYSGRARNERDSMPLCAFIPRTVVICFCLSVLLLH